MNASDAAAWAAIIVPACAALGTPLGLGLRALARGVSAMARELRELRIKVEVLTELAEQRQTRRAPTIKERS